MAKEHEKQTITLTPKQIIELSSELRNGLQLPLTVLTQINPTNRITVKSISEAQQAIIDTIARVENVLQLDVIKGKDETLDVIHSYTADEAINDGLLVELKQLKSVKYGRFLLTEGVTHDINKHDVFAKFVLKSCLRFNKEDFGELDKHDRTANAKALVNNDRIFASYALTSELAQIVGEKSVWVICEADRSGTTVLYPSEY